MTSLRQRSVSGSKTLSLQVNSLDRKKPKKAKVKAAQNIM